VAFKLPANLVGQAMYPAVCLKNAELTFNFGATPLQALPAGYTPLCKANVDDVVSEGMQALQQQQKDGKKRGGRTPIAIILEPARDLAEQTAQCIKQFGKYLTPQIKSMLLIGGQGVDQKEQV
jgi:ATP-dependent RNA helicase DDX1